MGPQRSEALVALVLRPFPPCGCVVTPGSLENSREFSTIKCAIRSGATTSCKSWSMRSAPIVRPPCGPSSQELAQPQTSSCKPVERAVQGKKTGKAGSTGRVYSQAPHERRVPGLVWVTPLGPLVGQRGAGHRVACRPGSPAALVVGTAPRRWRPARLRAPRPCRP